MCAKRDETIEAELARHKSKQSLIPVLPAVFPQVAAGEPSKIALAASNHAVYADQAQLVELEMVSEEHGVKIPSENDTLVAARTAAFKRGDTEAVANCDAIQELRRTSKRCARARKKVRKAELADWVSEKYGNNDPSSDNERL